MTKYVLDTDHISLILCQHPIVVERATQYSFSTTIITVQELFNGWVSRINDPEQINRLPDLYSKFWTTIKYLQTVDILNFTPEADALLRQLLKTHQPLRKKRLQKDLRIAAIALSLNATVVTRNRRDFEQVPGLSLVDWTVE